jgi:glycine dehydrogenase subunit 1
MRYIPNSDADRTAMLAAVGRRSLDELFSDIPRDVLDRFRPLGLEPRSEMAVRAVVEALASENRVTEGIPFLGGGIYDHYVPSVVAHLVSRSEFYTAYTPYQPEVSQGTLTAMFEFQTLVCELTGMEIANDSLYDGATAVAEAALMASRLQGRPRIAVARSLFPHVRRVLETYCWAAGIEIVEIPYDPAGRCDLTGLPSDGSALIVQSPNAFGVIEDLAAVRDALTGGLLIVSTNPIALGVLEPPGAFGADIVTAEGQPLGLAPSFGGPLLGLFAARQGFLRQMPGRLTSRKVDADGNEGYVMAAQTREQHIRRERATSNICTNAQLCALTATVYLASLGADGLRAMAALNLEKAHALADRLTGLPGVDLAFATPFFNEFTIRVPGDARQIRSRARDEGLLLDDPALVAGLGLEGALRIAVTEKRTDEEMDRLVDFLGGL